MQEGMRLCLTRHADAHMLDVTIETGRPGRTPGTSGNGGPMHTITLYHRTVHGGELVMQECWLTEPRKEIDTFREHVEPEQYILPAGYTMARSNSGTLEIYDAAGDHCVLVNHVSGRPQIVGLRGKAWPVLHRAVA